METSDYLALAAIFISIIISSISGIYTYFIHKKECEREKKQATLDAFRLLQEQVLDELNNSTPSDFKKVAQGKRKVEYKPAYDHYRSLLARIEHFAVGVFDEIYDFSTTDKLAAEHLIFLYQKVRPVIEAAREPATGKKPYSEFEWLVNKLLKKHPEIQKRITQIEKQEEKPDV